MTIPLLTGSQANLARKGIATGSSIASYGYPRNAIDGDSNGDYWHKSCTHTAIEDDPWWKVTFEFNVLVHEVILVNRGDCCGKLSSGLVFSIVSPADTNLPQTHLTLTCETA